MKVENPQQFNDPSPIISEMRIPALHHVANKKLLVGALNWGFGHVARCIPILSSLQDQGCIIWIACSNNQQEIFEQYLTGVQFLPLIEYPFQFGGRGHFALDLFKERKALKTVLQAEHTKVDAYVERYDIDLVLSDHRYGFYSSKVPSVFITHQVNLPVVWWQKPVQWLHERLMAKFQELWVLDDEDSTFAGKLSQCERKDARFLGVVSRFEGSVQRNKSIDVLVLVSGPVPYSFQFLNDQMKRFSKEQDQRIVFAFSGSVDASIELPKNQRFLDASDWMELDEAMLQTRHLVCRSGYTTMMDVQFLNCTVEWHPTPGQKEQQYLAKRH